jgi:hypothetical protein
MFAVRPWITTSLYRWPIGNRPSTCMLCWLIGLVIMGRDYVSELLPLADILLIPQMIWVWRATWLLTGKTEELGEKSVPVQLCPRQIPHALTRTRTRASAVRGRWLTAWATARPACSVLPTHCTKDVYTLQGSTRDPWTVSVLPISCSALVQMLGETSTMVTIGEEWQAWLCILNTLCHDAKPRIPMNDSAHDKSPPSNADSNWNFSKYFLHLQNTDFSLALKRTATDSILGQLNPVHSPTHCLRSI